MLVKCLSNFLLNISFESFTEFEETSSSLKDIGKVLNKRGAMLKKLVSLILHTLVFILVLLEGMARSLVLGLYSKTTPGF